MSKQVEAVEEIQEAEFTELEAEQVQVETPRCVVTVGMKEDGGVFFSLDGSEQSLINIEGLLKYAEKHVDRLWQDRLAQTAE